MNIKDLIVSAEEVSTGRRIIGYFCGCKMCRQAVEYEKYDHNRPIGRITHPDELYGGVRVYADNIEFVNDKK